MKRVFVHMIGGKTLEFRAQDIEWRTSLGRLTSFTLTSVDARFGTFSHLDIGSIIAITYRDERWWEGWFV